MNLKVCVNLNYESTERGRGREEEERKRGGKKCFEILIIIVITFPQVNISFIMAPDHFKSLQMYFSYKALTS